MLSLHGGLVERTARLLGIPAGTGELMTTATRKKLVLSIACSVILSVLDMVGVLSMLPMMQFITGQSVDEGALGRVSDLFGRPDERRLVALLALMIFGAFAVKNVLALVIRRWQLGFMAKNQVEVQAQLLEGYLVGPYAWHLTKSTSDKLWSVGGAVALGYTGGVLSALAFISELLTITLIFVSLLVISPLATAAAVVYFALAGSIVQFVIRPRVTAASRKTLASAQEVSKTSLQALTAVKEIKLRHAHGSFVEAFTTASSENAEASAQVSLLNEVPKYFLEVVFVLGVGLLALGSVSGSTSAESLTLIGIFVAAGTRILPSAVRLINAHAGVRFAHATLAFLVDENRQLTEARNAEVAARVSAEVPHGHVATRDLCFAYADDASQMVLRGVDLDIPDGRTTAIVGSSGAGKSTLVDILLGLHSPTSGSVTAGGMSIFDNLRAWQEQVAVVPQDVVLIDDTLATNIAFDEQLDDERLRQAVHRAQLADLVDSLPEGLQTEVGERGVRLSGGQRQRIGIARALYRRPQILFLDEATSALDNETERRLTETITDLQGTMTMVIVAHRLSTVRHADQLVFMSDGRVETVGTFDEVARANPAFARLVELGRLEPAPADPAAAP